MRSIQTGLPERGYPWRDTGRLWFPVPKGREIRVQESKECSTNVNSFPTFLWTWLSTYVSLQTLCHSSRSPRCNLWMSWCNESWLHSSLSPTCIICVTKVLTLLAWSHMYVLPLHDQWQPKQISKLHMDQDVYRKPG